MKRLVFFLCCCAASAAQAGNLSEDMLRSKSRPDQGGEGFSVGAKAPIISALKAENGVWASALMMNGRRVQENPYLFSVYNRSGDQYTYGVAGNARGVGDPTLPYGAPQYVVAAQLNARALPGGVPGAIQYVWGEATEAWAYPGTSAVLVGIEPSIIQMEPDGNGSALPRVGAYITFKNREDGKYDTPPPGFYNLNSSALRIESQPETGWSSVITLGENSVREDINGRQPTMLDLREVPLDVVKDLALIRFPDGYCQYYSGGGETITRHCDS